jgi:hypothetical protein
LIRSVSSLPFSVFQGHLIASQRTKNSTHAPSRLRCVTIRCVPANYVGCLLSQMGYPMARLGGGWCCSSEQ